MCFLSRTGNYQSVTENSYGYFVGICVLLWLGDAVEHFAGRALVA